MEKCKYGCGNDALFFIGKKKAPCCQYNVSKCPVIRAKKSLKQMGVPSWNKGKKTGFCWNQGKTFEELLGAEQAKAYKEKISSKLTGLPNLGRGSTEEIENQRKEKIRIATNQRYATGWMPKAGRCKKILYSSPIAGEMRVDGSWELEVAKYFDRIGVKWKRNKNRFAYIFEGKERFYTPDFYLEETETYIEVKGYETDKDRSKWQQFNHKLVVWKKNEINAIKDGKDILNENGSVG